MKTLQELQQEVRILEDELRGLGTRLGRVASELDELQHAGDGSAGIDFDAVRFCAKQLDFSGHPLAELEPGAARLYLTALLSLARFRKETDGNLLVLAQWILDQTQLSDTLSSLLLAGYEIGAKQLQDLHEQLGNHWGPMLVLDLLVGAGLSGPPEEKALEYIGEVAMLFQMDEDRMEDIAAAARCSLRQSLEDEKKKKLVDLPGYAKIYWTKDMRNAVFMKQAVRATGQAAITTAAVLKTIGKGIGHALSINRYIEVEEPILIAKELTWSVPQQSTVTKGRTLAVVEYWDQVLGCRRSRTICAKHDGTIYQFTYDGKYYGVISAVYDTLDQIQNWLRQQKGGAE